MGATPRARRRRRATESGRREGWPEPTDLHGTRRWTAVDEGEHRGSRGGGAQPQGPRRDDSTRVVQRRHGAVRLGEVLARVRDGVRGGPAPLHRVAVGVRAELPGADGQAPGRERRGAVARHLHRPEERRQQPPVDGGDGDGTARLPPVAVRPGRGPALPGVWPRGGRAVRGADGLPGARTPGGNEGEDTRAGRPRPEGRLRGPVRRPGVGGVRPRRGRRREPRPHDGPPSDHV
jgi:hypothetical protein